MRNRFGKGGIRLEIGIALAAVMNAIAESAPSGLERSASPGDTIYLVDPENGNDANPPGKPWKSYGTLNAMKLALGDQVLIAPGRWNAPQKLEGFKLPDPVLNHLYYWNAARLIPRVRQVLEARKFKIGYELGGFKFDRLPPDVTVNQLAITSGQPADLTGTPAGPVVSLA